jgi:crotonobetainyl-CoA:carnitine CoA-transferase CaiB-like acyl-CoA transferase
MLADMERCPDVRNGDGFARDFGTADGERVMVTAITRQQFADLARATRLARTFAFLERVLYADFSTCSDLYAHRDTIAVLLAPWFSQRTMADLATAFAGTSVTWAVNGPAQPTPAADGRVRRVRPDPAIKHPH